MQMHDRSFPAVCVFVFVQSGRCIIGRDNILFKFFSSAVGGAMWVFHLYAADFSSQALSVTDVYCSGAAP
jgi:hypothetical protein